MSNELPTTYTPADVEAKAYAAWVEHRAFHADPESGGKPYSIVIPPPNVTAALHLGHALNNTLQDILTRQHRMLGDNTVWLPGTDHAGIATQTVVEKRVMQEQGKRRTDFGREEFIGKIQAWKDEYEARITSQLKSMGCSCDWERQAFTMDEPRAKAVRQAFFQLFSDGLIYRGKRLVNWDPATQTALADDEVEMEEVDGHFYYMRYPLTDGTGHVTVATTRPETMLGDTAVAINPKDPRAGDLRGKHVRLPIVGREIPIIEDDYVVLPVDMGGDENDPKAQFATGFLKVTPAHDPNDYEIGRRHNLPVINVMAPDASISDRHGWSDVGQGAFVLGKSREEARKLIVDWFKAQGLLEQVKPYRHSVGHSYRSHVAIEPYLSDQWYCRVTDPRLSGAALRAMAADQHEGAPLNDPPVPTDHTTSPTSRDTSLTSRDREGAIPNHFQNNTAGLRFYPARYAKTFQTWHENIRDWCISRQLWWGHRIPVWSGSGKAFTIHPAWAERVTSQAIDGVEYVCLREDDAEILDQLQRDGFVQDPDVLDTWFSSALWPMSTLDWPDDNAALDTWNPTSVLCTAREIITLWVSRMVMFNLYFLNRLPFKDVFIHAMIQDGHGQKMSKSLGNGVDPEDIIATHGADAMRFTLASMATNTQDVRMPVDLIDPHGGGSFTPKYTHDAAGRIVADPIQESPSDPSKKMVSSYGAISGKAHPTPDMPVARNTSAKFDLGRNLCNKLWNAGRFVLMSLEKAPVTHTDAPLTALADRWILSRLMRAVKECDEALANYRFDLYAKACYDFFWRDFCDWYIEAIKPVMKDPSSSPATTNVLATVLDQVLRLMHPAIPFITETMWWAINQARPHRGLAGVVAPSSQMLIHAAWPTFNASLVDPSAEATWDQLQQIIIAIRNLRNEHKVEVKKAVRVSISAPDSLVNSLRDNRALIELLATCELVNVTGAPLASSDAVRSTVGACEMHVEGLVDESAEKQRKAKLRDDLNRQIAALKGRLANQGYIAKAPPHLVKQTQDQLALAEDELSKLT